MSGSAWQLHGQSERVFGQIQSNWTSYHPENSELYTVNLGPESGSQASLGLKNSELYVVKEGAEERSLERVDSSGSIVILF